MIVYLDSSSLFRLYHTEPGSEELIQFLADREVSKIFLSYISRIEFESTVWKKVRTKEIALEIASQLIEIFKADYAKFQWIEHSLQIEADALDCLKLYGAEGLRTLDSIHMASARRVSDVSDLFLTEDKLLKNLFEKEGLKTS
jgi:predicted nucleic acid-binding protein